MSGGKRLAAKKSRVLALLEFLGYTNCLGVLLVLLLLLGLAGGFVLAVLSIKYQYTGALACWTVVFTPHRNCHLHRARPHRGQVQSGEHRRRWGGHQVCGRQSLELCPAQGAGGLHR